MIFSIIKVVFRSISLHRGVPLLFGFILIFLNTFVSNSDASSDNLENIAPITSQSDRFQKLKKVIEPLTYHPNQFQFIWSQKDRYENLKDLALSEKTWNGLKEKAFKGFIRMSRDPTDTTMYGTFLLVVHLPENFKAIEPIPYAELKRMGYVVGSYWASKINDDLLLEDLSALGIGAQGNGAGWLYIGRPDSGIEIWSGEKFFAELKKDPQLAKNIPLELLKKAEDYMDNLRMPISHETSAILKCSARSGLTKR